MTNAWFLRDGLPLWLVALCLAAVAPWLVRLVATTLERRAFQRTRAVMGRLNLVVPQEQENQNEQGNVQKEQKEGEG